jgi:hypothetical protein
MFVVNVFCVGSKFCLYSMDIIDFRAPTRDLQDFLLFEVGLSFKNYRSTRCTTATNSVYSDFDICKRLIVALRRDIIISLLSCFVRVQFIVLFCDCVLCYFRYLPFGC